MPPLVVKRKQHQQSSHERERETIYGVHACGEQVVLTSVWKERRRHLWCSAPSISRSALLEGQQLPAGDLARARWVRTDTACQTTPSYYNPTHEKKKRVYQQASLAV